MSDSDDDPFAPPTGTGSDVNPSTRAAQRRARSSDTVSTTATATSTRSSVRSRPGYYSNGRRVRVQRWVFTIYREPWSTTGMPLTELPEALAYICGQPEHNAATGNQHFQGFLVGKEAMTIQQAAAAIGFEADQIYLSPSGATDAKKAIDYTKKDTAAHKAVRNEAGELQWKELGAPPKNHVNDQYEALRDDTKAPGANLELLLETNPGLVINRIVAVEKMLALYQKPVDRDRCDVYFLCGPTRTGKTHAIRQLEPNFNERVYVKMSGPWWDGYVAQEVIVLDDWRDHEYKCAEMLKILDRWSQRVPVKGSFRAACWTKVYITSNVPLELWYPAVDTPTRQAFFARIPEQNRVSFFGRVQDGTYQKFSELRRAQLDLAERVTTA